MREKIFESKRYFSAFDFLISHGQLLLRSDKAKGNDLYNIDIIFFDTTYVQFLTSLYGVSIRLAEDKGIVNYDSVKSYLSYDLKNLFEIETSKGEKYYIAASFFKVYENKLEFGETSLGVLQYKGRENEIAASR